jgi:curved DNA-binding protein
MRYQDYYKVLGVERGASAEEIKRAYRALALRWHPDRHGQSEAERSHAEAEFKRVNEAYEVLSDPEKRARYDQLGGNYQEGQEFSPPPGARTMSPEEFEELFGGSGGFSEFFERMFGESVRRDFGGRARRRARQRGADIEAELKLPLSAAVERQPSRLSVPGSAPCPTCGGLGQVRERVCPACAGLGRVRREREIELALREDVRHGQRLRLAGLGEPGEGAPPGDLLLTLRLEDDERYRRQGDDLVADLEVTPWAAVAGAEAEVRTPLGTARVKVPAGSRAGRRLRLQGQGLADGRGGRGDFYGVLRLVLPAHLSERQRALLLELARLERSAAP